MILAITGPMRVAIGMKPWLDHMELKSPFQKHTKPAKGNHLGDSQLFAFFMEEVLGRIVTVDRTKVRAIH